MFISTLARTSTRSASCRALPVVALLWLMTASTASAESLKSMPPGPRPLPVNIGVYLIDFEKIDELTLTQTIVGYLMLTWKDPRLAKGLAPELDRSSVSLDDVWNPDVEIINQHTPRSISNWVITIQDDGTVVYEERFTAELSSDFDLRRFPFDRQHLHLKIESFRFDDSEVKFVTRAMTILMNPAAFLPDWIIDGVSEHFRAETANPDARPYSQYVYQIEVTRRRGYYFWNVFLPLAFITMLAWSVFFITPEDVSTRTTIAITALLTAIAFSLVVSGTRPRVSYLTYMDALFLNAYFLIFVATAAVIGSHHLIRRTGREDKAEWLSKIGRFSFPVLALVTNILLVLVFIR
jgi:hypothetical protein